MITCRLRTIGTKSWGVSETGDNILYLIIGALVIVIAALSYQLYQDRKQPEGMRIDLGPNGLSIEKKSQAGPPDLRGLLFPAAS